MLAREDSQTGTALRLKALLLLGERLALGEQQAGFLEDLGFQLLLCLYIDCSLSEQRGRSHLCSDATWFLSFFRRI